MEYEVIWNSQDVLSVCPRLCPEQVKAVLKELPRRHDASFGITWDVIKDIADEMFPESGMAKETAANVDTDDFGISAKIIWNTEDVFGIRPDLTEEQADKVMKRAIERHDCDIGMNWAFLAAIANDLFPMPEGEN